MLLLLTCLMCCSSSKRRVEIAAPGTPKASETRPLKAGGSASLGEASGAASNPLTAEEAAMLRNILSNASNDPLDDGEELQASHSMLHNVFPIIF